MMNDSLNPHIPKRRSASRRRFLKTAAGGALASLVSPTALRIAQQSRGLSLGSQAALAQPGSGDFLPDVEIALTAAPADVQILPGAKTRVWAYRGEILHGPASSLEEVAGSYLGPTIRIRRHQKLRVHFRNELEEASIVHWHGLHVPATMDGHPRFVIEPGETFVYEFEVTNPAGTYWYHPHPHGRTGPQVYNGLAGLFLVTDEAEEQSGLPTGAHDRTLVIQDRSFGSNNELLYDRGAMSGMMGFLGNRMLVNGKPDALLSVGPHPYRLRLLNGSNSRIYKLAWNDHQPLNVIGTDGGLLEEVLQRDYVMLAPGERIELWADFRDWTAGAEKVLQSLAFEAGMQGPGAGMTPINGAALDVLRVRASHQPHSLHHAYLPFLGRTAADPSIPGNAMSQESLLLPQTHAAVRAQEDDPIDGMRTFRLTAGMMTWLINGRSFEMEAVTENEVIRMGATEIWEFINEGGMGMGGMAMAQPHPIHIHGPQFDIVEREVASTGAEAWETVRQGYVDAGRKDTVLVMPDERVRLRVRFQDHAGLFLYHCHNLEHEDRGMMRNYRVDAAL